MITAKQRLKLLNDGVISLDDYKLMVSLPPIVIFQYGNPNVPDGTPSVEIPDHLIKYYQDDIVVKGKPVKDELL